MKGKFLVLSVAIIALSIAGSATTLSYFTDSDSSVANFTIGQVKIRTITTSIARSESLSDGTSLVHTDNDLIQNSLGYQEYLSKECVNLLPDENGIAKCARYIFVQNTGTVPAYVRVKIQIPLNTYYSKILRNICRKYPKIARKIKYFTRLPHTHVGCRKSRNKIYFRKIPG